MERTHVSPRPGSGSKDGSGAADNDQPYTFGRRPRAEAPWPFTERQYARLLVVRGRLTDAPDRLTGASPLPDSPAAAPPESLTQAARKAVYNGPAPLQFARKVLILVAGARGTRLLAASNRQPCRAPSASSARPRAGTGSQAQPGGADAVPRFSE